MTHQFNGQDNQPGNYFEEIATLLWAPVGIAAAESMEQPSVQALLKGIIVLQERGKESFAQIEEVIEDLRAEVEAELAHGQATGSQRETVAIPRREEDSELAQTIMQGMTDVDTRIRELTNGTVDARSLTSLFLGGFALRQLLVKGPQLDDLPWYVLAWYALDSFVKFHDRHSPLLSGETTATQQENGNTSVQVSESQE